MLEEFLFRTWQKLQQMNIRQNEGGVDFAHI